MVNVVAALIEKNNKYLIARRASGSIYSLGKWEFPGGKVESHETEHEAIEREIKEELNINIKANEFLVSAIKEYPEKTINLKLYGCTYKSGEVNLNDHYEYKFVPMEEIPKYDLCDLDRELVLKLIQK